MKYIESLELREWVKDNLKKTIFQKAHALAVQTGCQILVKLQDDADVTQHQYYATSRLRKVFRQNGLREQTGEKFVSGVTGEPLVDQAIQSVDSGSGGLDTPTSHGDIADKGQESTPENEIRGQESGPDEDLQSEDTTGGDNAAIPMQLALSVSSEPFTPEDGTEDSSQTDLKPSQESFDNTGAAEDNLPVKIKLERIDDDDEDDPGGGGGDDDDLDASNTSMYQEQMGFDTTASTSQSTMPASTTSQLMDSSQFQGAPPPPAPVAQYQSYQVPMSPKPYQCAMCGKTFRSVQVLQKHTQTFHMKIQHVMGMRSRGRGRGRPPSRLTHQLLSHPQPSSYTCVMCNISFPDASVLQEHMTHSHMGGGATPHPQEAPSDLDFSAPGTSQQNPGGSNFPIPHTQSSIPGDAPPASQGSPYSQQGTAPAVPVYPRSISSTTGNRPASSPGTAKRLRAVVHRRARSSLLGPNAQMSQKNIMAAILQTRGPIVTHQAIRCSWRFLRHLTSKPYLTAANLLQNNNLGTVVTVSTSHYFVKKVPEKVQDILEANPDLCNPDYYRERFHMPTSSAITQNMRAKLIDLRIVPPDFFEYSEKYRMNLIR